MKNRFFWIAVTAVFLAFLYTRNGKKPATPAVPAAPQENSSPAPQSPSLSVSLPSPAATPTAPSMPMETAASAKSLYPWDLKRLKKGGADAIPDGLAQCAKNFQPAWTDRVDAPLFDFLHNFQLCQAIRDSSPAACETLRRFQQPPRGGQLNVSDCLNHSFYYSVLRALAANNENICAEALVRLNPGYPFMKEPKKVCRLFLEAHRTQSAAPLQEIEKGLPPGAGAPPLMGEWYWMAGRQACGALTGTEDLSPANCRSKAALLDSVIRKDRAGCEKNALCDVVISMEDNKDPCQQTRQSLAQVLCMEDLQKTLADRPGFGDNFYRELTRLRKNLASPGRQ